VKVFKQIKTEDAISKSGLRTQSNPDALLISTSELLELLERPAVVLWLPCILQYYFASSTYETTTPTVAQSRIHQYWKLEY
jgi:hypothetical protein